MNIATFPTFFCRMSEGKESLTKLETPASEVLANTEEPEPNESVAVGDSGAATDLYKQALADLLGYPPSTNASPTEPQLRGLGSRTSEEEKNRDGKKYPR